MSAKARVPGAYMWRGDRQPFYQRWWLKFNLDSGECLSFQVGINNPWDEAGEFDATGSFVFFDRYSPDPAKNLMSMPMWGIEAFSARSERFEVEVDGSQFQERRFRGEFHDAEHDKQIRFDFQIEPRHSFLLADLKLDGIAQSQKANTLWQAPFSDCRVTGSVHIDEETLTFHEAPGYLDVFWGRSIPDRWFWANCNKFDQSPDTWFVLGGGELEILGHKLPRWVSEAFPVVAALHLDGETHLFNSVLNRARFHFDKGEIRFEIRRLFRGIRLVYTSKVERQEVRPMDWHSPDDTILESGMALTAPATLEIYRGGLFSAWKLERTLTTPNAAGICGGARMDRTAPRNSLLGSLFAPIAQLLFAAYYRLRGLFARRSGV